MSKIKQAIKHTGRPQKEKIVAELVEKLDNSNGLVFADYQGLTHKQLEDLKRELKKLDSNIVVTKNSLIKLSLGKSKNFADYKNNEGLDRPTATMFIQGDIVEPLKRLQKTIKDFGLPKIKFGVLEGQALDEAQVLKIASLPNRETLLAQLAMTLNSPIQGLVLTLNANIQKFVMTLNAIAQSKPSAASNQPLVESEPAIQPDTLAETDESADAGTETKSEEPNTNIETNSNDQNANE